MKAQEHESAAPAERRRGNGQTEAGGDESSLISDAHRFAHKLADEDGSEATHAALARGIAVSEIVADLDADEEIVAGALLFPLLEAELLTQEDLEREFGEPQLALCRQLVALGRFGFPEKWNEASVLGAQQAEALRKMLLAIVDDVRLVLVRLADQLYRLRSLKEAPDAEKRHAALETREIYAPLANRLGIWHIKWELEDLAFRFLEPDTYKDIARQLAERREAREHYIKDVIEDLRRRLDEGGIRAEVQGRPKHIYSISKKMQRKNVSLDQVFDIRAVRVLVDTVADCYAVLGIVHGSWAYIPGEFDDYIATPKDNLYRSLHTAVTGSDGKPLEIQIRTYEMHDHAELGVAAHWRYKEGGGPDKAFQQKINWLRQILEPAEGEEEADNFIDRFKTEVFEDRVYALSPGGDVMDLPQGATPLDFAYHIHTDLGHRCRGARVNGKMVALTYKLSNGEQVEIITAKNSRPSRDWLIPQLGYLASNRALSKVRQWFRRQDQEHQLEQGRALLEKELQRLGVAAPHVNEICKAMSFGTPAELFVALGAGDATATEIAQAVERIQKPETPEDPTRGIVKPHKDAAARSRGGSQIQVQGVGDLMSQIAQCCKPVPPDPISGFITLGRGVSIHRSDCKNFLNMQDEQEERVISVNWNEDFSRTYPVDIDISAYDRPGLLKDVTALLSTEKINIAALNIHTDKSVNSAGIKLTIDIHSLEELSRVLHHLNSLPNIISASRRR
ncbi:MAG: GTP diphosphokinase [Gammaproteobacteria bacterium]|nr:GTP diphosphokinase [Gammaproteobacteria bacterium]